MISSASNSWMSEAWIAAPRAANEEGESAVESVEGAKIAVVGGNSEVRREAIRGVWDVPPERMTCAYRINDNSVKKRRSACLINVQNI